VWIKLGLGLLTLAITIGIGAIAFLIANNMAPISDFQFEYAGTDDGGSTWNMTDGNIGPWIGALVIWLLLSALFSFIINIALRFVIRAAHVAVVAEATAGGKLPEGGLVKYGMGKVRSRVTGIIVFFFVCRLVTAAANQIMNMLQRGVTEMTGRMGGGRVGGAGQVVGAGVGKFSKIFLGSITEVSMAWMFHRKDLGQTRAALQGLRIYFMNWKAMMGASFMTALIVIGLYVLGGLIAVGLIALAITSQLLWLIIVAVAFVILAKVIKNAFIDSWIMVKMVNSFMRVAPTTRIDENMVGRMRHCRKYRILEAKADQDDRDNGTQNPDQGNGGQGQNNPNPGPARFDPHTGKPLQPRFDPQTGEKLW